MAALPDPSPRLRVVWTHDGFACQLDGSGSVGPLAVLMGLVGLALASAIAVPSPLTRAAVTLSIPVAYFVSAAWAQATLAPIEVTLRRGQLTWRSGWQPTVTLDLATVHAVRARPWGMVLWRDDAEPQRLFSPSQGADLAWLAEQIQRAAHTARDVVDELDGPEQRARRAALDALRSPEGSGAPPR